MTLTKDKVIELVRAQTGFSATEARSAVEVLLEIMKSALERGEEVKISGFGKWAVRSKRSRPGRNPHTGERIEITARRVVTFQPSEKLRELVGNASASTVQHRIVDLGEENSFESE